MNQDLKIIKKKYGENMMHLCRELFPTILDNSPGVLPNILLDNFAPSHYLYKDIIRYDYKNNFKKYIYFVYEISQDVEDLQKVSVEDPLTLMKKAGYTLYECRSEDDIQKFRKYYEENEELCTFRGGRLNRCYVYFAVRDNADKLKRRDFTRPERQDAYGTSVISIQFTRDGSHTLSIKNRYNHTVGNPDATYSNDLDNIIPGLTQSFEDYYGMKQSYLAINSFDLPKYVRADDGRFYKYNYEINNVYYCPENIVIDNFQVQTYPQEKYLVMDYFILDLVNKRFINNPEDCFPETVPEIKKINIRNELYGKTVTITPCVGEDIIICLDNVNQIIKYKNNNVLEIKNNFLKYNNDLQNISLSRVVTIGDNFLEFNDRLLAISLDNVVSIGNDFLQYNSVLSEISLAKVETIGTDFLFRNFSLATISLPNVISIGNNFLDHNECIEKLDLPKVTSVGDFFLGSCTEIKALCLPELITIGNEFLYCLETILSSLSLPKVKTIGNNFLSCNCSLESLSLPEVLTIGNSFMIRSQIKEIDLPKVETIGFGFMTSNNQLRELNFPQVLSIGSHFMNLNQSVRTINMPNVETIGKTFLISNHVVSQFLAPKLSSKLDNYHLAHVAIINNPQSPVATRGLKYRLLKLFRRR